MNPSQRDAEFKKFQKASVHESVLWAVQALPDSLKLDDIRDKQGEGVTVAIIDTWPVDPSRPDPQDPTRPDPYALLDDAITRQAANANIRARLESLRDAVKNNGSYRDMIHGSELENLCTRRHECTGPREEKIEFSNHGLFVAGIIHEIAPKATLRIYRTFNDLGSSSTERITAAARRALRDARPSSERPLIINCSFYISPEVHVVNQLIDDFPSAGEKGRWAEAYDNGHGWLAFVHQGTPILTRADVPDSWILSTGQTHALEQTWEHGWLNTISRDEMCSIRALFRSLWSNHGPLWTGHVLPVAAAGNDSCRNENAVGLTRFPANLDQVLGVSAALPLNSDGSGQWRPAPYSNNDDIQKKRDDGVSAIGGVEAGDGQSHHTFLVGPYISDFLDPGDPSQTLPNAYDHALWSGTSFSTPVASAVAACVWSELIELHRDATGEQVSFGVVGRGRKNAATEWTPGDPDRLIRLLQSL